MSLFLKENSFCNYLKGKFPAEDFSAGHSVISINTAGMTPIMSCLYVDETKLAIAKYNRQLELFTEQLLIRKKDLADSQLRKKGINYVLELTLTEKLASGKPVQLALNLSPMTGTKWHRTNLQALLASGSLVGLT